MQYLTAGMMLISTKSAVGNWKKNSNIAFTACRRQWSVDVFVVACDSGV